MMTEQDQLMQLGQFLQTDRLRQNLTQDQVSAVSGVSRRTLTQLEAGKGGNILTLLKILYAIKRQDVWQQFEVNIIPSPLVLAKLVREQRKRATGTRKRKLQDITGLKPLNWYMEQLSAIIKCWRQDVGAAS